MNIHIINGRMTHLSPIIISSILSYSNLTNDGGCKDHRFYIADYGKNVGTSKNIREIYDPIFKKYGVVANLKYVRNSFQMIFLLLSLDLRKSLLFIHGTILLFYYPIFYMLVLLSRSAGFLTKVSLIAWGEGDFKYTRIKLILPIADLIYSKLFLRIRYLLTLSHSDFIQAKDIYKNCNVRKCSYMKELTEYSIKKDKKQLIVIVSHSGWRHNNHILSFIQLKHLCNDNIKVICPLCYGEEKYISEVIEAGRSIFQEKFSYFTELKSAEEYTELLNSAHIYVSNAIIQTGLFAVNTSLLGGAHVFLSGNLVSTFKKDGFIIRDSAEITEMRFSDLININIDIMNANNKNMETEIQRNVEIWKSLFNYSL